MKKITALIIDDERLAREEIKQHLLDHPGIALTGEAANADEAEELIRQLIPDLIFLDIQMPERSGLDLLETLDIVPEVIFTTAFDHYAVKAFELNALDYLVKPVRRERFEQAVARAMTALDKPANRSYQQNIFIREAEQIHFIRVDDIYLIESAGNYARLITAERKHYLKRSLNELEKVLDPAVFFRVSRTAIINVKYIGTVKDLPKGRLQVRLQSGQTLEISGRQSALFRNRNTI
jgi:two-component system, LytTR family, response regulator